MPENVSTAAGRYGTVSPSTSTVWPMQAASPNSLARRRVVSAGTVDTFSAYSGVYSASDSLKMLNAVRTATPSTSKSPSSAGCLASS